MSRALTARDFNGMTCAIPDCDHSQHRGGALYLHSRCHPSSPTWARYDNGLVIVECAICREEIARAKVADS